MRVFLRYPGAVALGLTAVLVAWPDGQVSAQRPAAAPPPAGLNPNVYANPLAAPNQVPAAAALGKSLQAPAGGAPSDVGYGSLSASYANSGLGYGSLSNPNAGGAGYGGYGGYGWATQWMMNPYEGYLNGAAAVTNANAQYQLTIQQAKLVREEARRSVLRTRREALEEAEYERAHMPDPEKIRQDQIARELGRARVQPPLTEVWSGHSLNVLLRHLIAQQYQGARGPRIPLNEDTLKSVNLTAGDTRGNVGLLKDSGNLLWPQPLQGEAFKEAREDFARRLKHAVSAVQLNRAPDEATLNDLQADLRRITDTLDSPDLVSNLTPDQWNEAKRYVRLLGNTVTALKDRNVAEWFNGNRQAKGKSVAELVKFMGEKGLWFAPAAPGDEPAYLALYHAMAAFDAGMPRVAGGPPAEGPPPGGEGVGDR
jgi:hypothetical protein